MRKQFYQKVDETVYFEQLSNGLTVYIIPKPGFQKTFATFTTCYGSIDKYFTMNDTTLIEMPDGIAHFLEHKMFEKQTGDVFTSFSSNGASANAYTSSDRTAYLFSATENIAENINLLLDFVQDPYFTDDNVHKEKGIIEQEIRMYQDHPNWRAFYGLLDGLYQQHPIHRDIAGTIESIAEITKEMLYECYRTFYHPQNMCLVIVGAVQPEITMEWVRTNQATKTFAPQAKIQRIFPKEPAAVKQRYKQIQLPVSMPKCYFGIKESHNHLQGIELLRQDIQTKCLFDILFSVSSPLYQSLYDTQLLTDQFGADFQTGPDYAFSAIGGDTKDPEQLVSRIRQAVDQSKVTGISAQSFHRVKRKKMGAYMRLINSPEAIANEFTKHHFRGTDLFQILEIYEQVTLAQLETRLHEHFDWEQMSICTVKSE